MVHYCDGRLPGMFSGRVYRIGCCYATLVYPGDRPRRENPGDSGAGTLGTLRSLNTLVLKRLTWANILVAIWCSFMIVMRVHPTYRLKHTGGDHSE